MHKDYLVDFELGVEQIKNGQHVLGLLKLLSIQSLLTEELKKTPDDDHLNRSMAQLLGAMNEALTLPGVKNLTHRQNNLQAALEYFLKIKKYTLQDLTEQARLFRKESERLLEEVKDSITQTTFMIYSSSGKPQKRKKLAIIQVTNCQLALKNLSDIPEPILTEADLEKVLRCITLAAEAGAELTDDESKKLFSAIAQNFHEIILRGSLWAKTDDMHRAIANCYAGYVNLALKDSRWGCAENVVHDIALIEAELSEIKTADESDNLALACVYLKKADWDKNKMEQGAKHPYFYTAMKSCISNLLAACLKSDINQEGFPEKSQGIAGQAVHALSQQLLLLKNNLSLFSKLIEKNQLTETKIPKLDALREKIETLIKDIPAIKVLKDTSKTDLAKIPLVNHIEYLQTELRKIKEFLETQAAKENIAESNHKHRI